MNIASWIVQIILGIELMTVAYTHGLCQSQPTMQAEIQKMGKFFQPLLYLVAACAFVGTMGLILPSVTKVSAWITPVTAATLSVMLLFSIFTPIRYLEKPKIFVSLVLFVFAAFVAYGPWFLAPSF